MFWSHERFAEELEEEEEEEEKENKVGECTCYYNWVLIERMTGKGFNAPKLALLLR